MKKAQLIVAGIGTGSPEDITPAVIQAVTYSDVVIGYKYYFQFIEPHLEPGTECIDTGTKREKARAEQAFELAEQGKTVCCLLYTSNPETGGVLMDFETVYAKGYNAGYWSCLLYTSSKER